MTGKYIMKSHVDFSREPFGKVLHYQIFDATGLQVGTFTGSPASAVEYAKVQSLTMISPARLSAIWAAHWPDPHARDEAEAGLPFAKAAAGVAEDVDDMIVRELDARAGGKADG